MSDYHFFELLRGFRNREGVSQVKLAQMVSVSRSTMGDWETKRVPNRDSVIELAQALELNGSETNDLLVSAGYSPNRLQDASQSPLLANPKQKAAGDIDRLITEADALWEQSYSDVEDAQALKKAANRLYQQAVGKVTKPSVLAADLQRKVAWYYRTRDQIELAQEEIEIGKGYLKALEKSEEWEVVSAELTLESAFCLVRDRDWKAVKLRVESIIQRFYEEKMPDVAETYSVVGRAYNMLAISVMVTDEPSVLLKGGYRSGWVKASNFLHRADTDDLATRIGIRDVESNWGLDATYSGDYDRAIPLLRAVASSMDGTEKGLAANNNLANTLAQRGDVVAGDITSALEIFEQTYKKARELDYLEMQLTAIQGQLYCWKQLCSLDEAQQSEAQQSEAQIKEGLTKGKAIFLLGQRFLEDNEERLSARFEQYSAEIAWAYANLLVACGKGDLAEAHFPSLEALEALTDKDTQADYLTSRAQLSLLQSKFDSALDDILHARDLHLKAKRRGEVVKDDLIHAHILRRLGKNDEADRILIEASIAPVECDYLINRVRQSIRPIDKES